MSAVAQPTVSRETDGPLVRGPLLEQPTTHVCPANQFLAADFVDYLKNAIARRGTFLDANAVIGESNRDTATRVKRG